MREGKELLQHVRQSYRDTAVGATFKFEKLKLVHIDQLSREVKNSMFYPLLEPKYIMKSFLHQFAISLLLLVFCLLWAALCHHSLCIESITILPN